MRRHPGYRRAAIPLALMWWAGGCTIVDPITQSPADRRFAQQGPGAPAAASAPVGSGCLPADRAGRDCENAPEGIDNFHGGLGRAMWEADLRRRSLALDATERSTLSNVFNALTWPIGSYLVAKKVREPAWSARDAVALGFASYKLLGEGVPERDRLYMQASNRLACSLVLAEAELYPNGLVARAESPGLQQLVWELEAGLRSHAKEREALMTRLELEPSKQPPKRRDTVETLRLDAVGKGGTAKAPADPTDDLQRSAAAAAAEAARTQGEAQVVLKRLDDAGARLRQVRSRIDAGLQEELQNRTAGPNDPFAVARQIATAFTDGRQAESAFEQQLRARAQSGNAKPEALPWQPTPARLKALKPAARAEVARFWLTQQVPLRLTQQQVKAWLASHQRRTAEAREQAAQLGCNAGSVGQFVLDLAKRAATPAAGASSAAPAASSSETALPAAPAGSPP